MLFKDEKLKPLNILLYLIGVTTIILIMQHFYKLMPDFKYELPIEFLVITVVSCFFLYLISGNKTFKSAFNDTGYVIKTLFPTLLFPLLFCVMGIFTIVMDKPALKDTWLFDTIMNLFCMMLVGIYEEVGFRFCACDAMLPVLKKTKHPFFWTSFIAGIIFGWVHVVWVNFANLQEVMQFVLKIANLTLHSATYMFLYWKTRSIAGLAIVHCLNDFLPTFLTDMFVFENVNETAGYTSGDAGTTIIYLIQLVVSIACFIYVYKKVWKTIDKQKVLEEW